MDEFEYNILVNKSPFYIQQLLNGNLRLLKYKNSQVDELKQENELLKDLNNCLNEHIFKIEQENIKLKLLVNNSNK
jgi:hypothetical protein